MSAFGRRSVSTDVRVSLVALTIVSILLTALVGIQAFYDHDGGRSSELEWQAIMTTLVMTVIGIATLCYLATAGTRYWGVGFLGGLVLGWSAAYTLLLIWDPDFRGDETETMMRLYGVGVILTVLLAQIALLLGGAGDRPRLRVALWPTVVLFGAAAALAVALAPAGGGLGALGAEARTTEHENAVFVAVAIIAALGIPLALALFGTRSPRGEAPLAAGVTRNP
jgi:hypothetical protein